MGVFLPLSLILYYWARRKHFDLAMGILTLSSLIYYAWWNPPYLAVIVISILVNFTCSHAMAQKNRSSKALLILGVTLNLGALFFFKYTHFLFDQLSLLNGQNWHLTKIILPLGISFFTFQQIAYLVDVHQQKVTPGKLLHYATFVTFFPQLIAGPIVHHKQMMPQFDMNNQRPFCWDDLAVGITIFSIGLFKKVIIADNLSPVVQFVFNQVHQDQPVIALDAWVAVLAYTFQIYFDFSGYCDMAIGASRMFGIILPLNFYSPYKSPSIIDFWRRWHITLSTFLRDYLYIPLGGNRHGVFNRYRNLMITMLLGGIWHGAGWGFLIWGALHGLFLIINQAWRYLMARWNLTALQKYKIYRLLGTSMTFMLVMFAWIFFRAHDVDDALKIILSLGNITYLHIPQELIDKWPILASWALPIGNDLTTYVQTEEVLIEYLPLAIFITYIMPNTHQFMSTQHHSYHSLPSEKSGWLVFHYDWVCVCLTVILLLLSIYQMTTSSISEFLYYDF